MAMVPAKCIRTKVPQVVEGGRPGRPAGVGMYLATESLLTSWPSFASSAAIRRRLQVGLSRAHPCDELEDLRCEGWPPRAAGLVGPESRIATAVPANDG